MKTLHILTLILALSTLSANAQNGWVREAKGLYTQAVVSNFSSNKFYNTDGQLFDNGSTFNSRGLLLFGEYGLTDRLTAVADIPVLVFNNFSTTETIAGVGSIQLGLKYGLVKSIPISIQVDFDIPTNDGVQLANAKEPDELGFVNQINIPTSDGEFNIWTTLAISQSFHQGKTFASLYGRINFRTESFSNQWQSGAEIGHLFFEKLYLIGKLKMQGQVSDKDSPSASFLYGEGTTYTSLGVTTMYKLNEKWQLIASYADFSGTLIDRKNVYDGPTFSVGVSLEL
jgi:hypothetical protein